MEVAKNDINELLPSLLNVARTIRNVERKAEFFLELVKNNSAYFLEALNAARLIQDDYTRAAMLCDLAQIDSTYSSEALSAAELIHDESDRARVLIKLATNDAVNFAQLLAVTGSFQDEISRARVLIASAENEAVDSPKLLAAVESIELIQYEYSRPGMWFRLAKINSAFRAHLLSFLQSIQNESSQVEKLLITNTPEWAAVLVTLAKIDSSYFSEALSALRIIQETSEPDLLAQNPLMASFCSDVWSLYEQILALMNLA